MILHLKITWIVLAVPGVLLTILTLRNTIRQRRLQESAGINGLEKITIDGQYARDWQRLFDHILLIVGVLMFLPRIDVLRDSPEFVYVAIRNSIFPLVSFSIGLSSLRDVRVRNQKLNYIRAEDERAAQ